MIQNYNYNYKLIILFFVTLIRQKIEFTIYSKIRIEKFDKITSLRFDQFQ